MKKIIAITLFALQSVFLVSSDDSNIFGFGDQEGKGKGKKIQKLDGRFAKKDEIKVVRTTAGNRLGTIGSTQNNAPAAQSSSFSDNESSFSDNQSIDSQRVASGSSINPEVLAENNRRLNTIFNELGGVFIDPSKITVSKPVNFSGQENSLGGASNNQQVADNDQVRAARLAALARYKANLTDKPMNLNDDDHQQPVSKK